MLIACFHMLLSTDEMLKIFSVSLLRGILVTSSLELSFVICHFLSMSLLLCNSDIAPASLLFSSHRYVISEIHPSLQALLGREDNPGLVAQLLASYHSSS